MRKILAIKVIVPDASPLITLGNIGRLDVLSFFMAPIHVVDVVADEARRPQNDRTGAVRRWWDSRPNNLSEIETIVGDGLRARRERGETPATGNLGEIAVDEYATRLTKTGDPNTIPMVLFEDPDVLELRVARLKNVHLLNTAGMLIGFHQLGIVPDAIELLERVNSSRKTPMLPIDRPARTSRHQSTFAKAVRKED